MAQKSPATAEQPKASKETTTKPGAARGRKVEKATRSGRQTVQSKGANPPDRTLNRFTNDQTITVLVKENPRRPGTKAFERFKLYKTGMKVSEYLKKGGIRGSIRTDLKRGNIEVK